MTSQKKTYRVIPQELPRKADSLSLPANPETFPLSPSETALIVVDMQNAYSKPGGYVDIQGFDLSEAPGVIERIGKITQACRSMGIQIIYFQNGWDADKKEAGTPDSPNWWKSNALKLMRDDPELDGTLITRGTWDYDLVDELANEWMPLALEAPHGPGTQIWINALDLETDGDGDDNPS